MLAKFLRSESASVCRAGITSDDIRTVTRHAAAPKYARTTEMERSTRDAVGAAGSTKLPSDGYAMRGDMTKGLCAAGQEDYLHALCCLR